jgi:hypothetical protein
LKVEVVIPKGDFRAFLEDDQNDTTRRLDSIGYRFGILSNIDKSKLTIYLLKKCGRFEEHIYILDFIYMV